MKKEELKKEAQEIFDTIERLCPDYKGGWGYQQIEKMVAELDTGNLTEHTGIENFSRTDELYEFPKLQNLFEHFGCWFEIYRKELREKENKI